MLTLVANLSGSVRREKRGGRDYLVAPVTLLVSGVLHGSQGPLFYPAEEVERSASAWNAIPIVVYHPLVNGKPISARDPDVLDKVGVGSVFRVNGKDGKVSGEAWMDYEVLSRVDKRVVEALEKGTAVEVSTGLDLSLSPAPDGSVHNGTSYNHIASNYKPDHLAILPDQVGACSIKDGCGLLTNTQAPMIGTEVEDMKPEEKKGVVDWLVANCDCWKHAGDREILERMSDDKLTALKQHSEKEKQREVVANAARQGFEDASGNKVVYNETTGRWDTQAKAPAPAPTTRPLTYAEWMATAPTEVQSAVRNALAVETREKQQLVGRLVQNVQGDQQRTATAQALMLKPIEELQMLVSLLPPAPTLAPWDTPAPLYTANGGQVQNTGKDDKDDYLPMPSIDWTK